MFCVLFSYINSPDKDTMREIVVDVRGPNLKTGWSLPLRSFYQIRSQQHRKSRPRSGTIDWLKLLLADIPAGFYIEREIRSSALHGALLRMNKMFTCFERLMKMARNHR